MTRMTDERLAELTLWVDDPHIKVLTKELVAALKAERQRVEDLEKENEHVVGLNCYEYERAETAEARVAELESLRKATIKLWYEEQTRRQEAEARLEAVRGLKRMEIKATQPHEVLFADGWNSLHDELEALLKEQTK